MMIKKILLLTFVMILSFQVIGQSYTAKRDKFGKEFQAITLQYTSLAEQELIKKELIPFLLSPTGFSDDVFNKMVNTCNLMESKKIKVYPEIFQYVHTSYALMKNEKIKNNYEIWHKFLEGYLEMKSSRKASEYLNFSASFWSDRVLGGKTNFSWIYRGGSVQMKEEKKEPIILLNGGDLICELDNKGKGDNRKIIDSVLIASSEGTYYPMEQKYVGKGGKITWEKVNIPADSLYAELTSKYSIDTRRSDVSIDTVMLKTPQFKQMVKGLLKDRAYNINREADKNHPQFRSFEKSLMIKDFVKDVDYEGGFKYEGANFVGTSVGETPAILTIYKEGKTIFGKVYADIVVNTPAKLFANNARVAIYLGAKDSISHQNLTFEFLKSKNDFEFTRTKEGGGIAPFNDSYHRLEITVPKLVWKKNSNEIVLTYGIEISDQERLAIFESENYYSDKVFLDLQGITSLNPLNQLHNYCYKYDQYVLTIGKFATALNRTPEQSQEVFNVMKNLGFITFDSQTKLITVTPKTERYIMANRGKIDYDNIVFNSDLRIASMPSRYTEEDIRKDDKLKQMAESIKKRNASRKKIRDFGTLDLATYDLNLNAIEKVDISQQNYTFAIPDGDRITVLKNRDFRFSGWIRSGKIEVHLTKGDYEYDKNAFNLEETQETILSVKPLKPEDGKDFIFLNSFVSNAKGVLYVDEPNNRSGMKDKITDFPKLDVRNQARVYYNDASIQRGNYDTARFYFELDPFMLDSLVNFNDKVLSFDGALVSANIFPKFREKLRIMPDYSLGFSTQAPKDGYTFYETKAKYNNKILLTNNGLQGSGKIEFIHSLSESNFFTFLPDSTIGYARFTNQPSEVGTPFPDAKGEKVFISYNPRKAYLNVTTMETPIKMFDSIRYVGLLVVKADGMTGNGLLSLEEADLSSRIFRFTRWKALSDTSNFMVRNRTYKEGEDKSVFRTENVRADLDFKTQKGEFLSNRGTTITRFPVNEFYCEMEKFVWLMGKKDIGMEASKDNINFDVAADFLNPNFFSTNKNQDSLKFRVPKARFSIIDKIIYCDNIEYIDIADARITPHQGKLEIHPRADIKELDSAIIVANNVTKYYTFDQSTVKIQASKRFEAHGRFMYKDADKKELPIIMERIYADSSFKTVALGKIDQSENFQLSSNFDYYGSVKIETANPLITFNGATRIIHECEDFPRNWMAFKAEIDPQNIQIPVSSTMRSLDGNRVTAGLVWHDSNEPEEIKVYPTFLSELKSPADSNSIVMSASGVLQYNKGSNEYQISNPTKLANRNEKGNYLSLHTKTCSLNGDGKIGLGMDYGDANVTTYGFISYDNKTQETEMNITALLRFPVMEVAGFEKWANKLTKPDPTMPPLYQLDWNNTTIEQAILEEKDARTSDAIKNEYIQKKEVRKMPKEFEDAIVISGIHLKSYHNLYDNGFITSLAGASIVNIFGKPVFKQIPFNAYFGKTYSQQTTGDQYQILLDLPGFESCFLDYQTTRKKGGKIQDGILQIFTRNEELKQAIQSKKEANMKKGNFSYKVTDNSAIESEFNRRF